MNIKFSFVPPGTVAESELSHVYLDVGNRLCPGVIDHHHSEAPEHSATEIVLHRPELVTAQVTKEEEPITLITHHYPDLDAVSATFIARTCLLKQPITAFHKWLALYTSNIDAGKLKLNPENAVCVYSVFLVRTHHASIAKNQEDVNTISLRMLTTGLLLLEFLYQASSDMPSRLEDPDFLKALPALEQDIKWVEQDFAIYRRDLQRAEIFEANLPLQIGCETKAVKGLLLAYPEATLFKSWARGSGFTLTAIQLSPKRTIISVDPEQGVYLKGLGELLEIKETEVREHLGKQRLGQNRPGYDSPDPWYDGRSALHQYTIIDSPRDGTVIGMEDIRSILLSYIH